MPRRREFGNVRELPSGRWQASFIGKDGVRELAPNTFATEDDAEAWLIRVRADLQAGRWIDTRLGQRTFREYAERRTT
jgi:hypothetical protein